MPKTISIIPLLVIATAPTVNADDANWSQFRGPNGNATATTNVPVRWSDEQNLAWKTQLPGRGASSPAIWGDRIFLTAFTGFGESVEQPGDKANLKLHVLAIDRNAGEIVWDKSFAANDATQDFGKRVADHGYATSTPATDGKSVYAFFGVNGVVAYDWDGNQMWRADVGTKTAGFGSAASPVVHGELVIVNASIESQTVFAFDKVTGKEVWKIEGVERAWTSACIADVPGESPELVINQKDILRGFNPKTGEQLWSCEGIHDYVVPVPVFHDGVVYCLGGRSNRCLAVKLGGRGDVTKSHKLWEVNIGANVTSPVYFDGHLYWASDKGIQCCLNATNGETVYRERLPAKGRIYASLIRAGQHLYVSTRDQGVVVLKAEPKYEQVAINSFESDKTLLNASPAVAGRQLFLRTDAYLYCIAE